MTQPLNDDSLVSTHVHSDRESRKRGTLTVVFGPMFAGKTTEMLARIRHAVSGGGHALVLKPASDTRYGEDRIASHDGAAVAALSVDAWPDIPSHVTDLFLDEVQFMGPPRFRDNIAERVEEALAQGINVTAGGLDLDWRGAPFPISAQLEAMSNFCIHKTSLCTCCGSDAPFSFKLVPNDRLVELGAEDLYEPRCADHWHAHGLEYVPEVAAGPSP